MKKKNKIKYLYDYKDRKVEITVIKQKGTCRAGHKVGDKFICTDHKAPKGLCGWAFSAIFPYIAGVAHDVRYPWEIDKSIPRATACCSDPINPVVFEIKLKKNAKK